MNAGSQKIEITPLSDWIGAEVKGVDFRHDLNDETAAIIRKTWLNHMVLRFRGQQLSEKEFIQVSQIF